MRQAQDDDRLRPGIVDLEQGGHVGARLGGSVGQHARCLARPHVPKADGAAARGCKPKPPKFLSPEFRADHNGVSGLQESHRRLCGKPLTCG